jgi:UDP-sulfoquinovose synthase
LTPIETIENRIAAWKEVTGKTINFRNLDLSVDYYELRELIAELKPQTIIHFGEQRAAPSPSSAPPPTP